MTTTPQAHREARAREAALELVACVQELRAAVAAAMRVLTDIDLAERCGLASETRVQRFVDEIHACGVEDGFGLRADALIRKIDGHE